MYAALSLYREAISIYKRQSTTYLVLLNFCTLFMWDKNLLTTSFGNNFARSSGLILPNSHFAAPIYHLFCITPGALLLGSYINFPFLLLLCGDTSNKFEISTFPTQNIVALIYVFGWFMWILLITCNVSCDCIMSSLVLIKSTVNYYCCDLL